MTRQQTDPEKKFYYASAGRDSHGWRFDGYANLGKDGLRVQCPSCGAGFGEVELPDGEQRGVVYLFSDAWVQERVGGEWICKPDALPLLLAHPEWSSRISPKRRADPSGGGLRISRDLGPAPDDPVYRVRCGRCGKHIGIAVQTLVEHAALIRDALAWFGSDEEGLARQESWLRSLRKECPPLQGFRMDQEEWDRQQAMIWAAQDFCEGTDLTNA